MLLEERYVTRPREGVVEFETQCMVQRIAQIYRNIALEESDADGVDLVGQDDREFDDNIQYLA